MFLKHVALQAPFIRATYKLVEKNNIKLKDADSAEEIKRRVDFEIFLWKCNDARTYMYMTTVMLKLDLTGKHVDLPVYHVSVDADRYFNNVKVEQHMRTIFKDFSSYKADTNSHSPSILATAKDAAPYLPMALRRKLSKKQ